MKKQYRCMVETRRLYKFEATFLHPMFYPFITKERSLAYLKKVAKRVWDKYGRKGLAVPSIKITKTKWSTCEGYSKIELALKDNTRGNFPHNTVEVLLHELVHAVGYAAHGRAFCRKYLAFLVEFGRCDEGKLALDMAMAKIKA